MKDRFKSAEDEYFVLRGRLEAGRITRADFLASVGKLVVRGDGDKVFVPDPDTGQWKESAALVANAAPMSLPEGGARNQSKPASLPEQRRRGANKMVVAALVAFILLCFISLGGFGLWTFSRNRVTVISTAAPPVIAARDYAASNTSLAEKITATNQAQLKFIRDMRASALDRRAPGLAFPLSLNAPPLTEEDLKDLAGKAMDVAILSDQLGELANRQDKGSSKAAQSAEPYFALARTAYSLVVDSQNVRQALQKNLIPGSQAIETIAQYGVQMWNNAVTDGSTKGNPFTVFTKNAEPVQSLNANAASEVKTQVNANNSSIWIAQSGAQSTRTLNVPGTQPAQFDPFDMLLKTSLTTSAGQSDGTKAQQVAASNLQKLGASPNSSDPSQPTQLQVPTSPIAVSGGEQIKAGNISSFKSGSAIAVSKNNPSDENPFLQSFGLNGDQPPTDKGKTTVQDAPALVNLNITNLSIVSVNKRPKDASNTFEADVNYSFKVNWTTNLTAPQFSMDCVGNNHFDVSSASGSRDISAKGLLILYPGAEDAFCYASRNGNTWGSASVHFLVGDPGGATQRANQVETDSVALDMTLTADARETALVEQTQAAATAQARGTSAAATAQSNATSNAVATEVYGTRAAEFKVTAAAAETVRNLPVPPSTTPLPTATFAPRVVDSLSHPGNVDAVATHVVLQRGRLYRFTFSGRVNVINPPRSLSASQLPDRVNGIAVPGSGVLVIEGTGGVATITCGHEIPDPKQPGAYGIVVEDLGPL